MLRGATIAKVSGLSRQENCRQGSLDLSIWAHLEAHFSTHMSTYVIRAGPPSSRSEELHVAVRAVGDTHSQTSLTIASHWLPTKRGFGFAPFTPSITISLRTSKRPSAPLSYDDSDE